jgi:hypothetical protein
LYISIVLPHTPVEPKALDRIPQKQIFELSELILAPIGGSRIPKNLMKFSTKSQVVGVAKIDNATKKNVLFFIFF